MDKNQLAAIIRKRLNLEDQDWSMIEKNPKFQKLFQNALAAAQYRLVAEVIQSKGCHSGHVVGQKLVFDNSGNLLTKESPERICSFAGLATCQCHSENIRPSDNRWVIQPMAGKALAKKSDTVAFHKIVERFYSNS